MSGSVNESLEICETISISKAALFLMLEPSILPMPLKILVSMDISVIDRITENGMKSPKLKKMK